MKQWPKGYLNSEELYCYIELERFKKYGTKEHRNEVIRQRVKFNNIWNLCMNDTFDAENKVFIREN